MKFTDRVYKALKFIALVALPAVGTLYFTLAGIWHFPDPEKVIGSITAVDTFLGLLLHISTKTYDNSDDKYDGTFGVVQNPDGTQNLKLLNVDMNALNTKSQVIFKIQPGVITQVPDPAPTP
jgi:hypothetical protein